MCDGGRGELKPAAWPRSGVQGAEGFLMLFHLILFDASGPLFTRFCFVFCFYTFSHNPTLKSPTRIVGASQVAQW